MSSFEERLLQKIQEYKVLIDSSTKSQKIVKKRDEAWRRVAKDLGVPVGKCRQRWRSLRERFKREKKLMQDPDYLEFEQWEFYKKMVFLDDIQASRESENSDDDTSLNLGFEEFLTEEIPSRLQNTESAVTRQRTQTHAQFEELFTNLSKVFTDRFVDAQPDDSDLFIKLIVRKMSVLPKRNQMRLQEKIFRLVNEEILAYMEAL